MTIRVLGTSFNVRTSSKKKHTQVSVLTGSVEVSTPAPTDQAQTVVLAPLQHAYFEHQSKQLLIKTNPTLEKKEIYEPVSINFNDQPLGHVIELLEKRFDVQLKLAEPNMANCLFNGDFEHQSLAAILEILCLSLEATYSISENTIVIDGTACV
jgi:ferric-dicitrate binding protein FerR (iron transport regulator)